MVICRNSPSWSRYARESPTWPDEECAAARHRCRGEGGGHAAVLVVGERLGEDGLVRIFDRFPQRVAAVDGGAQCFERGGARDLAGAVPTHAVGDGHEAHRLVDEVAVFVAFAHTTDIGRGADHESHVTAMSACDLGDGAPELHLVTTADAFRSGDGAAVQQGAVARAQILDVDVAVAPEHTRVHLRDERVVEHDTATAAASDRELVAAP